MNTLILAGIPVQVTKKKMRTMRLHVKAPRGTVTLSVPPYVGQAEMEDFVQRNLDWIAHRQACYAAQMDRPEHRYADGERLYLFDTPLTLQVIPHWRPTVTQEAADTLTLRCPADWSCAERKRLLDDWYRGQMYHAILPLARKWEPFLGVKASQWKIRDTTSRWGSCNTSNGSIMLSLRLSTKPAAYLEYVLVHELCHLLERGHNPTFWAHVARCLPDWNARRKALNAFHEDAFADPPPAEEG